MFRKQTRSLNKKKILTVLKRMRMQVDELPHVTPDVDYTQILPIQQKRTIAFVNHFIMNSVSYLNNFAHSCESRFMEFEYKMQKLEASLLILEAQLLSIPEFDKSNICRETSDQPNDKYVTQDCVDSSRISTEPTLSLPQIPDHIEEEKAVTPNGSNETLPESEKKPVMGTKASEDPRYIKFFKMLRVGVQEQAVKLKMKSEGFNPNILDNPDSVIPEDDSKQENNQ